MSLIPIVITENNGKIVLLDLKNENQANNCNTCIKRKTKFIEMSLQSVTFPENMIK